MVSRSLLKYLSKWTMTLAITVPLLACTSSIDEATDSQAFIEDNTLVLYGPTDRAVVTQLIELANNNPAIKHFKVRSSGGEPMAAIDWGYYLYKNNFSLEVEGYCLDSCANYLFPAASSRHLQADAIVAWSGGTKHDSWLYKWQFYSLRSMKPVIGQYVSAATRRENRFYNRIMVYQRINMFGYDPKVGCMNAANYKGFYYSVADLLMLGVGRVSREGASWDNTFSHYPDDYCMVELDPVEMLKQTL